MVLRKKRFRPTLCRAVCLSSETEPPPLSNMILCQHRAITRPVEKAFIHSKYITDLHQSSKEPPYVFRPHVHSDLSSLKAHGLYFCLFRMTSQTHNLHSLIWSISSGLVFHGASRERLFLGVANRDFYLLMVFRFITEECPLQSLANESRCHKHSSYVNSIWPLYNCFIGST